MPTDSGGKSKDKEETSSSDKNSPSGKEAETSAKSQGKEDQKQDVAQKNDASNEPNPVREEGAPDGGVSPDNVDPQGQPVKGEADTVDFSQPHTGDPNNPASTGHREQHGVVGAPKEFPNNKDVEGKNLQIPGDTRLAPPIDAVVLDDPTKNDPDVENKGRLSRSEDILVFELGTERWDLHVDTVKHLIRTHADRRFRYDELQGTWIQI